MFDHDCTACGRRQLIFPSQIQRLVNDEQGIVVVFSCWCGAGGALRIGHAVRRLEETGAAHVLAS